MARREHSIWSQIFIDICGNKVDRSFTFAVSIPRASFLLRRIDHADVVLAAHGYPQPVAVRTEERLVRRTADVYLASSRVRLGVDQPHGVGHYRKQHRVY